MCNADKSHGWAILSTYIYMCYTIYKIYILYIRAYRYKYKDTHMFF